MKSEHTQILIQIKDSAGVLPPTMSMPLSKALDSIDSDNYRDTLIHLLDFFEMSVQWLNCYMLAMACGISNASNMKGIARAVKIIDTKRPLSFGDCVNEIFNPLLETLVKLRPDNPLLRALSDNVKSRKTDILVGSAKVAGIIKIRNDYKGHTTSLSEDIYRGVVESIMPKVADMTAGLAPLKDAMIYAVGSNGKTIDLHGGWNPDPEDNIIGTPYHYYAGFPDEEILDLYPLIIQREDRYIYVFQTLKNESVKYESSDENVRGFETEDYNQSFDLFMQRLSPSFDIAKESNWNELCDSMRLHSMRHMIQVQKEKKYNSELFVDRKLLSELLRKFEMSGKTLLPLAGDAGQGKTNQMCHWTERLLNDNRPVLIFNSASFSDVNLSDTLKSIFGVSYRRPLKRLLDHLHDKAVEKGKTVFFFFDAINECLHYSNSGESGESRTIDENAPLLLYKDIVENLINPYYTAFKVVTTCRSYTWKNQILPSLMMPEDLTYFSEEDEMSYIAGFTDEETESAYSKYQELYQMTTPFSALERKIILRLSDPLIMKFVCSNYVGSSLSAESYNYTSINLFSKMMSDIRDLSFAGRKQCELLEEMSRIILHSYLEGRPSGSIINTDLRNAYMDSASPLHRLSHLIYRKDGLTVAYTELRNKPDRPILREVEKTVNGERVMSIEFIYERFLEYMMARVFLQQAKEQGSGQISADRLIDVFKNGTINVVFLGAMRNALIMEILRTGNFNIITDLISLHNEQPGIMDLVNDTLDALIRDNYEETLFLLIDIMISARPEDPELIGQYNIVKQQIASNKANSDTIVRHNEIALRLQPTINLKNTAIVAVNSLLLSDFFNENLYSGRVFQFLWKLIMDEITDVSNETCKFVYYLSRRKFTHGHNKLKSNLTRRIVKEMYRDIQSRTLMGNMLRNHERRKCMVFVEAATRLATLLIIDATISPKQDVEMIKEMLDEIKGIAGYFTWRYRFMKAIMPFLQTIMRKQITFQSVYVNNAVEYQGFWNTDIVPTQAPDGEWSRPRLRDAMDFVGFFQRHSHDTSSEDYRNELKRFENFRPVVVSSYRSGCSFSYFIMERIVIIVGSTDWNAVRPIFQQLLDSESRSFEWFDYMQMSLQYSLLQLQIYSLKHEPEILEIITKQARDWTLRCRGLFKARHSHKANPTGLYKRNVMNWYCVAYCIHTGDNIAHEGDSVPVPLLYELIDIAVRENDKELLLHLLDNISELISDYGYVKTALSALKYVMTKFETPDSVAKLDAVKCNRNRFANDTLVSKVGSVLSTAKTYFFAETDSFMRSEVIGLKFPGVETYREEILNYHPSGETLSDLFTHKFGNFLLWSLLHEKAVDDFSYEAVCSAIDSKDCFAWFDQVIRILCKWMFNVKL